MQNHNQEDKKESTNSLPPMSVHQEQVDVSNSPSSAHLALRNNSTISPHLLSDNTRDGQRTNLLPSLHSFINPHANNDSQQMLHHTQNQQMRPYDVPYHLLTHATNSISSSSANCDNNTVTRVQTDQLCGKKRKINKMACVNCSKLHKKCDGESPVPCTRCAAKGLECVYMERRKRGPKTKRTKCGGGYDEDDYDCTDANEYRSTTITSSTVEKFPFPSSSCHNNPTSNSFSNNNPFSLISSMLGAQNKTSTMLSTPYNNCQPQYSSSNEDEEQPTKGFTTNTRIFTAQQLSTTELSHKSTDSQHTISVPHKTLAPNQVSEYRTFKILICATGSVASIKIPELISLFLKSETSNSSVPMRFEVRVAFTDSALHFCPLETLKMEVSKFMQNQDSPKVSTMNFETYTDKDEWNVWSKRGDPVTHVELKKWADVLLLAPLDANTLAKIANGLCDNLVTCVCRAWELDKPFIVCPAMNSTMWTHPFTKKHLDILNRELGVIVIEPISKTLMCGDTGIGAMASVDNIFLGVKQVLQVQARLHQRESIVEAK
jgi:phosphopantothenoylcysteine decarboxylase